MGQSKKACPISNSIDDADDLQAKVRTGEEFMEAISFDRGWDHEQLGRVFKN
jgi:hypothetical protein